MKARKQSIQMAQEAEAWFYQAITAIKTPEEAKAFLEDLLTPAELQAMIDRWMVVKPLRQAIPYRKIHELTGVSVTTIGRVARTLTLGRDGYLRILKRLEKTNRGLKQKA